MPTELWGVAAGLLASWLAALAGLELKRGAGQTRLSFSDFHLSGHVLWAIGLYLLSSLFFLLGLLGAQLSVLIPVVALEYVWVTLLASKRLHEQVGLWKRLGIALIVLGVVLVGLGS
ncbi:MAG: hypothetical protein V3U28_04420 [Candidatus Acidoferrales bacterium]